MMMTEGIWEIVASTGMDVPRGLFFGSKHAPFRETCLSDVTRDNIESIPR